MAVKRTDGNTVVGNTTNYVGITEYQGLSTDTKPTLTESQTGSEFLELDTGSYFVWHVNAWVEL